MQARSAQKKQAKPKAGSKRDQGLAQRKNMNRAQSFNKQPRNGTRPRQSSVAAAYATGQGMKPPAFSYGRGGQSVIVKHREFVTNVTGSVDYTVAQTLAINPGIATTFPWLSTVAPSWERYRFRKLRFCFYTRTGSNVPGSVLLAPDYDAADDSPPTEQMASSYQDAKEDAPWKDICCEMQTRNMNGSYPEHYTRSSSLLANQDIKTYDVANLFVCTVDGTAVSWGKLWAEYECEFFIPQIPAPLPAGGYIVGATAQTGANPLGTAPVADANMTGISVDSASVIRFQRVGEFLLSAFYVGTVITVVDMAPAGGITQLADESQILAAATGAAERGRFRITSLPASVTLGATATTITGCTVAVAQAPDLSLN